MKLRYLLLPLSLLLGGYLLQHPQGQAWLGQPGSSPLPASTRHSFYKWQDGSGHWHYSDQAPAGQPVLMVQVDTAANILPAPRSLQAQSPDSTSSGLLDRLGSLGHFTSPAEARQQAEGYLLRTRQMIEQH